MHGRNALQGEYEGEQQQEAQNGRHCILVGWVEVGPGLLSTHHMVRREEVIRAAINMQVTVMSFEQCACDLLYKTWKSLGRSFRSIDRIAKAKLDAIAILW